MIRFDNVVQVLAGPMLSRAWQLAFPLQPANRFPVGAELVRSDRRRRPVAHGRECFAQETMGRACVSPV
jgi:hypothetical protein